MNSVSFTIVLVLGSAATFPASAEDLANIGASAVTCARYNADRPNKALATSYVDGAQGFLSGFNMSSHLIGKMAYKKMPEPSTLKSSMDSYCAAHADQALMRGLMLMWKDLPDIP